MLVHVHTANSLPEAQVVSCTLEAAGIPHNLNGIAHASVSWMMLFALGGIRISVPESLASDAIERLENSEFNLSNWQSEHFRQNWPVNIVSAITWLSSGIPYMPWLLPNRGFKYRFGMFLTFLMAISIVGSAFFLFFSNYR